MIARVERALRCAFNKRAQKRALHLERFATETSLVRVRHMENGKSNPVCSKTPSPSAGGRLFSAARRATFSAPTSRKRLHLMRSETGIFLLVFSTHAPHQGAFSRLPCSPRLRGEREKTGNGVANPGFRWRSTLGYSYFAPTGAWTKHSAVSTAVACGARDIKGGALA